MERTFERDHTKTRPAYVGLVCIITVIEFCWLVARTIREQGYNVVNRTVPEMLTHVGHIEINPEFSSPTSAQIEENDT